MIGPLEKSEKRSIAIIKKSPHIIIETAYFVKNHFGDTEEFCIKIMKKNIFAYCIHKRKKIQS